MERAHRRPDGTFEFGGDIYRLEDGQPDHFVVRRLKDAKKVGVLKLIDDRHHAQVEVEDETPEPGAARAIARLLDGGAGIVPLQ